jgi:hypothetical protein
MKKTILGILIGVLLIAATLTFVMAAKPTEFQNGLEVNWRDTSCATIQDGGIHESDGVTDVTTGFNDWGYNYQAHMFSGDYCDAYHNAEWCQEYAGTNLIMKWNDAWLSNEDCSGDGKLDRPTSYKGSGAWETNHMSGSYEQGGQTCHWTDFVKIVAVPTSAYLSSGTWYTDSSMETEIGPAIWGDFAIIEEVYNDPCAGYHGVLINPTAPTGFGFY